MFRALLLTETMHMCEINSVFARHSNKKGTLTLHSDVAQKTEES